MQVTQKSQYALRAVFELAKRYGGEPVKISQIAEAQAIPQRFLENILVQLKQTGLLGARRGHFGGYYLLSPPEKITIGDVLRVTEELPNPVRCIVENESGCPLWGDCVFLPVWQNVSRAVMEVYDGTTFQDLIDAEEERKAVLAAVNG